MMTCRHTDYVKTAYDNSTYTTGNFVQYSSYSLPYPVHSEEHAPAGLIPVELDVDGLYEDYDRRKKNGGDKTIVSSHVHSVRFL